MTAPPRTIGTLQLVGMIYFMTAGGGYGLEPLVAAGGPLFAIAALLITPLVFSVPQALMTAELSALYPEDGGVVVWVHAAFGRFWAFQAGWISLVNTFIDNALYPVLFSQYIARLVPMDAFVRHTLSLTMLTLCTTINLLGIDLVGWASVGLSLVVTLPFVLLAGLGFAQTDPAVWGSRVEHPQVGLLVASALWNFSGYDSAGACAGEVIDAERTYPRALGMAVMLAVVTMAMPVMAAVTVNDDWAEWGEAFWVTAANRIAGGNWLGNLVTVGGLAMSTGMLVSLIATSSRSLYGMCTKKLIPSFFGYDLPRSHTPFICILFIAVGSLGFTFLPFSLLIIMDSMLYVLKAAFEFASLVSLRVSPPPSHDPSRRSMIPFGRLGLALVVAPAAACVLIMAGSAGFWSWMCAGLTMVSGVPMFYACAAAVKYEEEGGAMGLGTAAVAAVAAGEEDEVGERLLGHEAGD